MVWEIRTQTVVARLQGHSGTVVSCSKIFFVIPMHVLTILMPCLLLVFDLGLVCCLKRVTLIEREAQPAISDSGYTTGPFFQSCSLPVLAMIIRTKPSDSEVEPHSVIAEWKAK